MSDVQALVQRAQSNDRAAFGELYELYCPKIYSYIAYHLNGRAEAAEDLTEEVFMKALQNLSSFQFRDVPFSSWLYRIAHNHLIDHIRSTKKVQSVNIEDAEHLLFEKDRLDGRLDRHTLTAALSKITDDQRQIVLMRVVQGLSITETAKAVGKSEDSVKQLQSRGLKALKRVLEAQGGSGVMMDPFDAALSAFIDTLPEDPAGAGQLLTESAPFSGQGDLPALAELATMLRAVEPYQPRPEWMATSKARLMAAPVLPPEKRGFTWLGSMFLPLTQLTFPTLSLPKLNLTSPLLARGAVALAMIVGLTSVARHRTAPSPIIEVTGNSAQLENAQQAIAATQAEFDRLAREGQVAGVEIEGSPRDVVLLAQQIDLAELAIEDAPPADQPALRSQLQSAVKAVRFDGQLEGITNGSTLQVSGVAVQADPSTAKQLQVGQPVSLLVTVGSNGKLQAVQVSPLQQHPSAPPAPASPAASAAPVASPQPSTPPVAPPAAPQAGGNATGPLVDSGSGSGSASSSAANASTAAPATDGSQTPDRGHGRRNTVRIDNSDGGQSVSVSTSTGSGDPGASNQSSSATVVVSPPQPPSVVASNPPASPAPPSLAPVPGAPSAPAGSVAGATTSSTAASGPQVTSTSSTVTGGGNQTVTVSSSSHTTGGSGQTVTTSVSTSSSSGGSTTSGGSTSSSHSSTSVVSSSSSSSSGSSSSVTSRVLQVVTSVSTVSSSSSSSSSSSKGKNKK